MTISKSVIEILRTRRRQQAGDLSFLLDLSLAPEYDMLPMMYASLSGVEVVERKFRPELPLPKERATWMRASEATLVFWYRVGFDDRVTTEFREIAQANAIQIERLI